METLVTVVILGALIGGWYLLSRQAKVDQARERERLKAFVKGVDPPPAMTRPVGREDSGGTGQGGHTAVATDVSVGPSADAALVVQPADALPTFADVGGMDALKTHLRETVGLLQAHPEHAQTYGIAYNGLLLHGPPGAGKSYLARCLAGEFGRNLIHVSTGDLVEGIVGASSDNIQRAFDLASANRPCVLFLDEFDSIAQRRETAGHAEERRTVNQLLIAIEAVREDPGVLVVAATNDLDHLDPAVLRSGRFDRQVRVDLPDEGARRAILDVHLQSRPVAPDVDTAALASRLSGRSAADLARLVEDAALLAFAEAAADGQVVHITSAHFDRAIEERGGDDRPMVEGWTWGDLVLPPRVLAELQQLEALLAEPDMAARLGVETPRGVLLTGPPGTGKTTIARVLAAQARCSFYPVSAADVSSRWHGESERSIQRLFARARANRPSIIFIDEIDAIAGTRAADNADAGQRQLTQLLTEMDGMTASEGVLVIGATNRPDTLDPALRRGGRMGRTIEVGLPDEQRRLELLRRLTERMPTVGVDLQRVAEQTEGMSPADLRGMCQQAAMQALVRARTLAQEEGGRASEAAVEVLAEDMARAIVGVRVDRR